MDAFGSCIPTRLLRSAHHHIGRNSYSGLRRLTTWRAGAAAAPAVASAGRQALAGIRPGIDTASANADTSYVARSLPIVGRAAERDAMAAAYASAAAGQSQVLLITGEAGIGKTRLIEELIQQVRSAGGKEQVRLGESAPLAGAALAYGPFVAALGERAAWLLADDEPGDMAAARHRLFERVLALLADLAAEAPLLLVLEDLHWADESSHELLAFLAVRLRDLSGPGGRDAAGRGPYRGGPAVAFRPGTPPAGDAAAAGRAGSGGSRRAGRWPGAGGLRTRPGSRCRPGRRGQPALRPRTRGHRRPGAARLDHRCRAGQGRRPGAQGAGGGGPGLHRRRRDVA